VRQINGRYYQAAGRVATAPGAATSVFVPEMQRLFIAVAQRKKQQAATRVYEVQD